MIVIGIDPGLTGAIAVVNTAMEACVYDMPTFQYSPKGFVKRAVDLQTVAFILRSCGAAPVFLEKVNAHPGQGVSSVFSFGMSYWGVAGAVAGLYYPLTLVAPQDWKAHFFLGKDKELARALAARLYPKVDLSKAKHHGRAEALLIAKYGLDKSKGLTS